MGCKRLIIYTAENQQNGYRYVGATTKSLRERKLDHLERAARGQNGKLYEAIRTYGSNAFMWQTIDTSMTINELAKKEIY